MSGKERINKPANSESKVTEYVTGKFEVKEITEDENNYIVTGYASVFNGIDSYDDRIQPGAYADTIKDNPDGFPAFIMHKTWDGEIPVGLWYDLSEDKKGLLVSCKLPKGDSTVSGRLVPQIKVGSVDALSIGYYPMEFRNEEIDGESIRILEKIILREISFISKGYQADADALLTDLKKKEGVSDEQLIFNARIEGARKGASPQLKKKITEFYFEKGLNDPFEELSVLSTDELKVLSKANLAYAIRELKLSTNASNYLAGLVLTSISTEKSDPKSQKDKKDGEEPENNIPSGNGESEKSVGDALDNLLNNLKTQ